MKKGKKPNRVTPAQWPTQYMVLWRTNLDDVPLLVTPDRKAARAYARTVTEKDVKKAHSVMGIDICGACSVAILAFRNGVPYRLSIVKQFDVSHDPA